MKLEKCKTCEDLTTCRNIHNGDLELYCNKYDKFPYLTPCNTEYFALQKERKIRRLKETIAKAQEKLAKLEERENFMSAYIFEIIIILFILLTHFFIGAFPLWFFIGAIALNILSIIRTRFKRNKK